MTRALGAVIAAILFTSACVPNAKQLLTPAIPGAADACSSIPTATSVQILLPPGSVPLHQNVWMITDPAVVRQFINFVDQRRDVGPYRAETPLDPKMRANLYDDTRRTVGIFGAGDGIFYLQCGPMRGIRYASAPELAESQRLIARPRATQCKSLRLVYLSEPKLPTARFGRASTLDSFKDDAGLWWGPF